MWKLSVEDDQGNKTTVNLVRDEYTVGRAQENTVRLTERNISRRHAVVRKNGAGWNIEDQTSYNGCFVNGARVCELHPLEHGDLIQLGDYRLRVVDEGAELVEDQTPTARGKAILPEGAEGEAPTEKAPDRLIMLAGPTPGAEFAIDSEQMLIGRGEECDISINHTSVSRVHAEVHRVGDGRYELIDSDSANGVRVNGNELRRALLESRDTIELGDISLKLVLSGEDFVTPSGAIESVADLADSEAPGPDPMAAVRDLVKRIPLTPKQLQIAAGAVAALIIVVVGIAVLSDGNETAAGADQRALTDDAAKGLAEAKALLDEGQVEAAHQMAVASVPEQSNLRESADFKQIEARWADMVLARAAQEADPDQRRALLDQVARATTVDSTHRKRAADELSMLSSSSGVDVSDLPEAMAHKKGKGVRPPPAPGEDVEPIDLDEPVDAPAAPAKPAVAKAPNPAAPREDNPYEDAPPPVAKKPKPPGGTADKATSGDRSAQIAAKDALKAKVRSGRASDQEKRLLRALCRQYNDASCVN